LFCGKKKQREGKNKNRGEHIWWQNKKRVADGFLAFQREIYPRKKKEGANLPQISKLGGRVVLGVIREVIYHE